MKKEATLENLKKYKCRSAWSKGVKEYAYMLLDHIFLCRDYKSITDFKSLHEALLRGLQTGKGFLMVVTHLSRMILLLRLYAVRPN